MIFLRWFACIVLTAAAALPARAENPAALVAAASSMKFAFDDLLPAFHAAHPEFRVKLVFGSSGNHFAQITHGAPFDAFFSADMEYPEKLAQSGYSLAGSAVTPYAAGKIVLWLRSGLGLDPREKKMDTLLDPRVRKISIANPRHAPYGRAAIGVLNRYGLYDRVQSRLIQGENITQAAQFVHTGAAEAGLIALSLARTAKMAASGSYWEIPQADYAPIRQGYLLLKNGGGAAAARAFAGFVGGPQGRALLLSYGFEPLAAGSP